ncbi:MAG: cytochrome C oxidase subunit IV family protein [Bacteroidia bacterium]|nr:cytochrome C oxidase subunit IV family protein [Bacteroidia bacterium]
MSDVHHEVISHESQDKAHSGLNTKMIWKVFWILLGITIFEVGISFTPIPDAILLWTFITLTLVKAYYIVGFFMHMKFEAIPFQWSILLPFILIVYLIFIALYEGTAIGLIPG